MSRLTWEQEIGSRIAQKAENEGCEAVVWHLGWKIVRIEMQNTTVVLGTPRLIATFSTTLMVIRVVRWRLEVSKVPPVSKYYTFPYHDPQ
jgi:hypothetical protein